MTPAMVLSWLFGLILIYQNGFDQLAYFRCKLKLILIILLTVSSQTLFLGSLPMIMNLNLIKIKSLLNYIVISIKTNFIENF